MCAWAAPLEPVRAQHAQCGFIADPDQQAHCRAITGSGSGQCGFIRDFGPQALCRAQTGR